MSPLAENVLYLPLDSTVLHRSFVLNWCVYITFTSPFDRLMWTFQVWLVVWFIIINFWGRNFIYSCSIHTVFSDITRVKTQDDRAVLFHMSFFKFDHISLKNLSIILVYTLCNLLYDDYSLICYIFRFHFLGYSSPAIISFLLLLESKDFLTIGPAFGK